MGITGPACFGFERGWVSKGLRQIEGRPDLFHDSVRDEAQYLLGLGNRQVLALEYWLRILGLVERVGTEWRISEFGRVLREHDPQVEEIGSWFAFHYRLANSKDGASTYWYAVNRLPPRFGREDLREGLMREFPGKSPRTYQDAVSVFWSILGRTPLGQHLLVASDDTVCRTPDPPHLPDTVLLCCMALWCRAQSRTSVNLLELAADGAPGRVFLLSDAYVREFLSRVQDRYSKHVIWWSQTAGLDSIAVATDVTPLALLRAHFLEVLEDVDAVDALDRALDEEKSGGCRSV